MIPQEILEGLKVASGFLPALGMAILMSFLFDKQTAAYLFLGFVLSALLNMSMIGIAIIGAIIAYVVYQNSTQTRDEINSILEERDY